MAISSQIYKPGDDFFHSNLRSDTRGASRQEVTWSQIDVKTENNNIVSVNL